jgi:hypothetical protein
VVSCGLTIVPLHTASVAVSLCLAPRLFCLHTTESGGMGEGVCALFTMSLGMFEISNIPRDIVILKQHFKATKL